MSYILRRSTIRIKSLIVKKKKTGGCELISTCPYYNDEHDGHVIPEKYKEQYCHGIYVWCGRYLSHRASEERTKRIAYIERR